MMAEDRTTTPLEDEDSDDYDYLLRGDKGRGGAGKTHWILVVTLSGFVCDARV